MNIFSINDFNLDDLLDPITKKRLIFVYDKLSHNERETVANVLGILERLRKSLYNNKITYSTFCERRDDNITFLCEYLDL